MPDRRRRQAPRPATPAWSSRGCTSRSTARPTTRPAELSRTDLERVLRDVREAVEDWPKMQVRAQQIADEVAAAPPRASATGGGRDHRAAALAGRCPLHVPGLSRVRPAPRRRPDRRPAARAMPGTGLGILRADQPQDPDYGRLPREVSVLARQPQAVHRHQGEQPVDGAPAGVPRLRRGQDVRRRRRGRGRAPLPRAVHLGRLQREHPGHPGAAPQGGRGAGAQRAHQPDSHSGKDLLADPGDLPARRAVPDLDRRPGRTALARAAPAGAPSAAAVPAPRRLRPVHVLHGLPAA